MKQYIRFEKNVSCGRFCMVFSISEIEFESSIGAICRISPSICSVNMSADMKATLANDTAAYTKADKRAASIPKRLVMLLVTLSLVAANFFMKNIMSHMHPPNLTAQRIMVRRTFTNEGISIVPMNCEMNR